MSTSDSTAPVDELATSFTGPASESRPRPLWFWNARLDPGEICAQVAAADEAGYAGFGVVATAEMSPAFMSPAYLDVYRTAVEAAAAAGNRVCLYDDFWFPSGTAGGEIARSQPWALSKRLDAHCTDVSGPTRYTKPVPGGTLMAAVAMNLATRERVDLRDRIVDGWLPWNVPEGRWRIMFFCCVIDGAKGLIDYLDPAAVDAFVELTYERYRSHLSEHLGSTIDLAFHDETTFHWVEGGRAWTASYNERFQERHGVDPAMLYPALWFDIGPETSAARCLLFGFRAELFSRTFVRRLAGWCDEVGIELTGHVDQEEIVNPTGLCGDLMKCFEHQHVPGVDQIFHLGRARKAAKVVSSAAVNYGRTRVMCECYGVVENMSERDLYREAADLYVRGVNLLMPHAMWYQRTPSIYPPDLSPNSPEFGSALPTFNRWASRVQSVLQRGLHVAEIAVLYPINSLHAGYRFGAGVDPYEGGVVNPEADYLDVGDVLLTQVHRDFVYLHPEVFTSQCFVASGRQGEPVLRHKTPRGVMDYPAFILPGSTTISVGTAGLLRRFHDAGGMLIATTQLPDNAADAGGGEEVRDAIEAMFGPGGRGVFLQQPDATSLRKVLESRGRVWNITVAERSGRVASLHKRVEDRDFFFFANSSDDLAELGVTIRGDRELAVWNPADGTIGSLRTSVSELDEQPVVRFDLSLAPVHALFVVAR